MSRIGKQPLSLPDGVTVTVDGQRAVVTGPRGELALTVHPAISLTVQDGVVSFVVAQQVKGAHALWGTMRALLANMVAGVVDGYRKQLELHGIGFRAVLKGDALELSLGFSHPVVVQAPPGVTFSVEKETITVEGIDKTLVGQVAADIRSLRPPEPYKGKGIRYRGEHVRRKVGKVVGATG